MNGLRYLETLSPSSIKMGLERVRVALARLGNPERSLKVLHVAGTNGKGSTCAFAASCLSQRYRTGLYTSPHLERVNERIAINGVAIDDDTLSRRIDEVRARLGESELTYFEFTTLVAFWHFARERIDVVVLETGLGGRLDATTACTPLVTAVTPIGFDHQAYLGTTLESIAGEKAGIAKPGVPLVVSRQLLEAQRVFEAVDVPRLHEGRDFRGVAGPPFSFQGRHRTLEGVTLSLRGPHQVQNAAVALACLEVLHEAGFPLTDDELRRGLETAVWPGRFEIFPGMPPVVLDGAHNPAGVEVLLRALQAEFPGRPVELVFGVFADKDFQPMVEALFPRVRSVQLTALPSPRSLSPAQLLTSASSLNAYIVIADNPVQALERARARAASDGVIVVAGSLSLIGALRPVLAR